MISYSIVGSVSAERSPKVALDKVQGQIKIKQLALTKEEIALSSPQNAEIACSENCKNSPVRSAIEDSFKKQSGNCCAQAYAAVKNCQ